MTNQEAIERLKCMRLFMQINDKSSESKFLEEDYIANSMAVEAIEKQIPKKVNNISVIKTFPMSVHGDCPNCGSKNLSSSYREYCNACGQKLDWAYDNLKD